MKNILFLLSFIGLCVMSPCIIIEDITNISEGTLLHEYSRYAGTVYRYADRLIVQSWSKIEEFQILPNGQLERISFFETLWNFHGLLDGDRFYNINEDWLNGVWNIRVFDVSQSPMQLITRFNTDIGMGYIPAFMFSDEHLMITDNVRRRTTLINKQTYEVDGYIGNLYGSSLAKLDSVIVQPLGNAGNYYLRFHHLTNNNEIEAMFDYPLPSDFTLYEPRFSGGKLLAIGSYELLVLDIQNMTEPTIIDRIPATIDIWDVIYTDEYVFMNDHANGLEVYAKNQEGDYNLVYDDTGFLARPYNVMHYSDGYLYMNKSDDLRVYDVNDNFSIAFSYGKYRITNNHIVVGRDDIYYVDADTNNLDRMRTYDIYSVLDNTLICSLQYYSWYGLRFTINIVDDILYITFVSSDADLNREHIFDIYRLNNQQAILINSIQVSTSILQNTVFTENRVFFYYDNNQVDVYDINESDLEYAGSFQGRIQYSNAGIPGRYILNHNNNTVNIRDINDFNNILYSSTIAYNHSNYFIRHLQDDYFTLFNVSGYFYVYNYSVENNSMNYVFYIAPTESNHQNINHYNGVITKNAHYTDTSEYYTIFNGTLHQIGEKYDDKSVAATYFFPERNKMVQVAHSGIWVYDIEYTVSNTDQVLSLKNEVLVYPNPARGGDVIFSVGNGFIRSTQDGFIRSAQPEISIYNIKGQLVKKSKDFRIKDNDMVFVWDKKNEQGQGIASGVYFYKIKSDKETRTGKFLLMK